MTDLPKLFDLTGRVAVVTGAAGLLGKEFCQTLTQAGAKVVVADIDFNAADALSTSLNREDIISLAVYTDVTSEKSVQNMVSRTIDVFGSLDILVNGAVRDPKFDPDHLSNNDIVEGFGAFETYPLEAWRQALDINLTGVFLCCQAVVRPMLNQGQGVIINLSSIYGLTAPDQRMYLRSGEPPQYKPVYYSVTKSAILGLTRYLAAYYAGRNIRVNALSPGGVYNGHDQEFVTAYSARTILGRMAEKEELNGALLFLASDASAYMTGTNLVVDGGWTTW